MPIRPEKQGITRILVAQKERNAMCTLAKVRQFKAML